MQVFCIGAKFAKIWDDCGLRRGETVDDNLLAYFVSKGDLIVIGMESILLCKKNRI